MRAGRTEALGEAGVGKARQNLNSRVLAVVALLLLQAQEASCFLLPTSSARAARPNRLQQDHRLPRLLNQQLGSFTPAPAPPPPPQQQQLGTANKCHRRVTPLLSVQQGRTTAFVWMGVSSSSSRSGASSPQQTSTLIGDDRSGGGGYGAAASDTSLGAAVSGEPDPEDPGTTTTETTSKSIGDNDSPEDDGNLGVDEPKDKNDGLSGQILSLAIPALVALSVDPLMSAVDTAYIGRLGADLGGGTIGLGALALNTNIFSFSFYIFNFLATVPTPFVASARARGDADLASRLVGQLLTVALLLGLALMMLLELAGPELLHVLGATAANEDQALLFLRTRAISAPAVLMMSVGNGAFRGFLDTKTPLLIGLAANLLNFCLDPILIFKLGLGLQGAAIATVAAEWLGAAAFLVLLAMKDPTIRLRGVSLPRASESWEQGRAVLTSSAAVFGRTVALQGALSTATAFAARAGAVSIAAHQVASQLYLLLAFMADSLAVAAQILVADRLGSGMVPAAREVAVRLIWFSLAWGVGLLVVFQVFGDYLPLMFTSDKEVLTTIAPVIAVVGLLQPLNAYVFIGDGILQGSQDFVYEALTMAVSASFLPGYILLHGFLTGDKATLLDVWVALVIMQSCRSLTFTFRHFRDRRGPLAVAKVTESEAAGAATKAAAEIGDGSTGGSSSSSSGLLKDGNGEEG